ncbi:hypothetical protein [Texcoconibacillus texcoconensis]|nr:hypothetical protein [Texcoconibacillus texcoconensis]
MFWREASVLDVAHKQFVYKLKAYINVFSALVGVQLLGLLFSLNPIGGSGTSSGGMSFSAQYYSGDIIVWFTLFWGFVVAVTLTQKGYRDIDFTFVSNRLSHHLSNISFLLTTSLIGGVSALCASVLLKVIIYFMNDPEVTVIKDSYALQEWILGVLVIALYLFLLTSSGYFVGMLVQLNKIFIVILPAILFGFLILELMFGGAFVSPIVQFFATETSFLLFSLKVLITSSLLFVSSVFVGRRLEVRS